MGRLFTIAMLVMIMALQAVLARADYYTYVDQNGVVCMTNNLASVPAKSRGSMKIVKEDKPSDQERQRVAPIVKKENPASNADEFLAAKPVEPEKPVAGIQGAFKRSPWLKPLLFLACFISAFWVVLKVGAMLPSPHLARALTLAFLFGVFVFGYKRYAEQVVDGYFTVKGKVLRMVNESNKRDQPASGEQVPDLDKTIIRPESVKD